MRTAIVFVLGLLLGGAVATWSQENRVPAMGDIDHVGIALDNFDESISFYTQKLGFREIERRKNDKGETMFVFVQVGKNTFLELAPANANRPAGLTHFGIGVSDVNATVAGLKDRGVMATAPRNVGTQWDLSSMMAPGSRIELVQLGPESSLGKATASFK